METKVCYIFLALILAMAGMSQPLLDFEIDEKLQTVTKENLVDQLAKLLDRKNQGNSEVKEYILTLLQSFFQKSSSRDPGRSISYQAKRSIRESVAAVNSNGFHLHFWRMAMPQRNSVFRVARLGLQERLLRVEFGNIGV